MLSGLIEIVLNGFCTERQLREARVFFEQRNTQRYNHVLSQAFERIQIRQRWIQSGDVALRSWLGS